MQSKDLEPVVLDGASLSLEQVQAVARGAARVAPSQEPAVVQAIERSRELMLAQLQKGEPIYGVTTGVGDSASCQVGLDRAAAMQRLLVRKCGCGSGPELAAQQVRAAILIRANCLSKGNSGVRRVLIERLCAMLDLDLLPRIPAQGSVGASGDLVPASYIAATLIGERVVRFRGREMPAAQAWAEVGLEPLVLQPKEGLALLNGTHVTAGIGSLVILGARRLVRIAEVATAMACEALGAIDGPFHPFFEQVKPHPGLAASTEMIRWTLQGSRMVRSYRQVAEELPPLATDSWRELPTRVQDNYSIRCAPHCTGALRDCLTWAQQWLEIEINSTNDNPLFDGATGTVHSGGNFSGFHVGLAMDSLKTALASVADQVDRQFALLVDEKLSNGLPPNLAVPLPQDHPERGIHHAFKGVQLAVSALTAEALQRTMPMTAFSRSTECHNQDKVSMATIAARQAAEILELAERVCAMHLLACCQALELRGVEGMGRTSIVWERVRAVSPFLELDRELDGDIERVAELIRSGELLEGFPA